MDEKAIQSLQRCKTKAVLTQTDVLAIFMIKVDALPARRPTPGQVASRFGVTEKTIRDIWAGRTWRQETKHLDVSRVNVREEVRRPGRPKGNRESSSSCSSSRPDVLDPHRTFRLAQSCINSAFSSPNEICVSRETADELKHEFSHLQRVPLFTGVGDDPFHDDWPYWSVTIGSV
mmetsp:Transcript_4242/g.12108  ORF Transcript_4242/g.12108 Transcript_4242/m.12108 type:complete len:175 (+) Transcript_4242:138-662(+)|eukprot:CAMPEP_0113727392 /NCGR_PEP_ID=MMETSP0038_2-20120614/41070_1 /TAXON_ID=2898 /ORGANISM="Cryptomonas paramecium" /LENGTH=174 /DNA_ID=CAMNT_0000658321 /DNA_START=52 /DNA_END=576 /DNA_ORIENTATION=+ /assembly_acc=CAM_ASM_000170